MKQDAPTVRKYPTPQGVERVDWKAKVPFSHRRKFTFKERLLIFLGYDMDIYTQVFCERVPGKVAPNMSSIVSPLKDPKEIADVHAAWMKLQQVSLAPADMPPAVPTPKPAQ